MISMRELDTLVEAALIRYRRCLDYEDIEQEARIAAWQALARPELAGFSHTTLVYKVARWAVVEYLRSNRPSELMTRTTRAGIEHRGFLSWEEQRKDETKPMGRHPDFAPRLIERLTRREEARAHWRRLCEGATPRQRDFLRLHFAGGLTKQETAQALGVTLAAVSHGISAALNTYRVRLGLPVVGCGVPNTSDWSRVR